MKDCVRCGFTLPLDDFRWNGKHRASVCSECERANRAVWRVAGCAASHLLRVQGARALLRMGLPVAALAVLDDEPWPSIPAAFGMQSRAVANGVIP